MKVTGFVTPAARYCAIAGGTYHVRRATRPNEQGTCTFERQRVARGGFLQRRLHAAGRAGGVRREGHTQHPGQLRCASGKSIDANFINGPASHVKLMLSDGRTLDLPQTLSGSGARYANAAETIVFWNKGNTAFIEESGKTTYEGCATKA